MRNVIKGFALALSASFIVACGGGGGAVGKALDHEIAMLKIVEANKADVAKATSELEAYLKTNEADLKAIKEEMEKLKAEVKDDMSKVADIMKSNAEKMQAKEELKKKLREEAKDVMGDDKVRDLLREARSM
jgi:Skp family chaperone for outer membrane proteins